MTRKTGTGRQFALLDGKPSGMMRKPGPEAAIFEDGNGRLRRTTEFAA
jgi:hypothetical protein